MTNTGLLIYDFLKGTHVRKAMRFLDESQHWSLEELEAYQEQKLRRLLEGAIDNVPFYNEYQSTRVPEYQSTRVPEYQSTRVPEYQSTRVPEYQNLETSGIQVFRYSGIPIIDRQKVIEAGDELLSGKINLKKCKVSRTGGTTGPPLRLYKDTEERSWSLAAYYRFYSWMGIEPGMPEIELWGSPTIQIPKNKIQNPKGIQNLKLPRPSSLVPRTNIFNKISNFKSYNAFSFNDDYLAEVVKKLQRFQPKLIRGYLSAILLLADYIKRNNIKGIQPIAVSSTSETLFPEYRKLIEAVFQAPLFNQYGCGECNSIAFECKEHNGMHISMEHCILESDKDNNLIVTNLDNHSQPFIRYKNGDIGVIDHSPCACGNAAPRLIDLQGRANENIILKDGSSVNGIFFANLLDEIGIVNNSKMLRFQIVQNKAGEIEFKAEVKPVGGHRSPVAGNGEMKSIDFKKLEECLMPFFNKVVITRHEFLDSGSSGKFRYLISNI